MQDNTGNVSLEQPSQGSIRSRLLAVSGDTLTPNTVEAQHPANAVG